jgi:hypothetical protein
LRSNSTIKIFILFEKIKYQKKEDYFSNQILAALSVENTLMENFEFAVIVSAKITYAT